MKPKSKMKEKPQAEINTVLYAVAPQPKLSTDAIALDGAVVSRGNGIGATSETYLMDCIVGMKRYPDKYFDLAVVDPPYGLQFESVSKSMYTHNSSGKWKKPIDKNYKRKDWDNNVPTKEYFDELFRVSKNFIIWGANYFDLPPCKGLIVWDKLRPEDFSLSQGELAYTSLGNRMAIFKYLWNGFQKQKPEKRYHPTQKPLALYEWIFANYSEPGQRVIDTHLGGGASRIAAHKYDLHFTGFEIDEEYFLAQEDRFQSYQIQLKLFPDKIPFTPTNEL